MLSRVVMKRFQGSEGEGWRSSDVSGGRKGSLLDKLAGTFDGQRLPKSRCRCCLLRLVRVARPAEPLRIIQACTLDPRSFLRFTVSTIVGCCATLTRWARVSRPHRPPCSGPKMGLASRQQTRSKPKPSTLPSLRQLLLLPTLQSSSMTRSAVNMSRVCYDSFFPPMLNSLTPILQARNLVLVNTPMSSPHTSSPIPPSSSPSKRSRSALKSRNGASHTILFAKSSSSRSCHIPTSSVYSPSFLQRTRTSISSLNSCRRAIS